MKILLTGFDPFGGETINPSWQAVCKTAEKINFAVVKTLLIPTEYYTSVKTAVSAIERFSPDVVICVGQAGGRASVNIERIAVNIADSDHADNAGVCLHTVNCPNGPEKLCTLLPVQNMADAINSVGLPALVSDNAGRFVCNHLFYGLLKYVSDNKLPINVGFIHVPFVPEQTISRPNVPSMSLTNISDSILAALSVLDTTASDLN